MNEDVTLICFASWEDRFRLGFERDIDSVHCASVVVLYFDSYAEWTKANRTAVVELCRTRGIDFNEHCLELNQPAVNWHCLCSVIAESIPESGDVLLDISTMPREVIWNLLWLLGLSGCEIGYRYHCPAEYSDEWLSRDPGAPRLVYKLSGSPSLSARTALLVTAGYDPQRVRQLIAWYEPEKTIIGLQGSSPFKHNAQMMADYRAAFEDESDVTIFELDAYSEDHGEAALQKIVSSLVPSHNVVMSSLGPKLSAISLYCVQRTNETTSLAYAPSNQFNKDYSHGIGTTVEGVLRQPDSVK